MNLTPEQIAEQIMDALGEFDLVHEYAQEDAKEIITKVLIRLAKEPD